MQTVPTVWTSREDFNKSSKITGIRVPSVSPKRQPPAPASSSSLLQKARKLMPTASATQRPPGPPASRVWSQSPERAGCGWTTGAKRDPARF